VSRSWAAGAVLAATALAATAVALAPAGVALVVAALVAVLTGLAMARAARVPAPGRREWLGLLFLAATAWLLNAVFLAGPRAVLGDLVLPWSVAGARTGVDTAIRLVGIVILFRGATRGVSAREALALSSRLFGRRASSPGVLLLVALRLAPTLGVEAQRLQRQRALRGDWPGPAAPRAERERRLRLGVGDLSRVTLPLFLLTLSRAEELAWTLPARYYGLGERTPAEPTPWGARERIAVVATAALLAWAAWARWVA
jgi:energy-coupling factor transporter transmembrane protein EcfT